MTLARGLLVALLIAVPPGCGAINSLNSAASPTATYELQPAGGIPGRGRTSRTVAVEVPRTSAAIGTDRILIKPNPLAVNYLGDGRWVEAAPAHVQWLLIRSIAATGRTGGVGGGGSGALPDYDLLSSLDAFEAVLTPSGPSPVRVDVALTLTLVRGIDGRAVGTRTFQGSVGAASTDAAAVVSAFNVAASGLLRDASAWALAAMTGGSV
ncbi:MAG: ABC-type transport auxiliary lipoprotein family protein [Amaricoccus sp.]